MPTSARMRICASTGEKASTAAEPTSTPTSTRTCARVRRLGTSANINLKAKKEGESMTTNTTKNRRKYEQMFRCGQNRKVGVDTLVFNVGAATDCPSLKLGLCQVAKYEKNNVDGNPVCTSCKCYAMTKERYPTVVSGRRRQAIYWAMTPAYVVALDAAREADKRHRDRYTSEVREGCDYIRISESGDMYTQADVDKLALFAKWIHVLAPRIKKICGGTTCQITSW